LYKAADLFDKAKDPRGSDFRKKLGAEYPKSEWATKKPAVSAPRPAATAATPVPSAAATKKP